MTQPPVQPDDSPETPDVADVTGSGASAFEQQAEEAQGGIVREFFDFLKHNKKWWLTPIVVVLLMLTAVAVIGGGAMPFIYTLF